MAKTRRVKIEDEQEHLGHAVEVGVLREYDHLVGTAVGIKDEMAKRIKDNWKIEGGLCSDPRRLGWFLQVIWR